MFETYQPSGRFGLAALPAALIAIVIAVFLSLIYQLSLHWIPLIYVNVLATAVLGGILGTLGTVVISRGKVRSVLLATLIGLLLTLITLAGKFYFQHNQMIADTVAAIMAEPDAAGIDPGEVRELVRSELTFSKHIQERVDQGWQIGRPGAGGGAPISGIFVYIVWLIELGIVSVICIGLCRGAGREPFSEKLNEWASEKEVVMNLPVTDDEMVSQIKAATSVDQLMELPIPKTDQSNQFAVYTVNSIPGQELEDAYLSVDLVTVTIKNNETKTDSESLVAHAIFSSEQRKKLIENAELLSEALADYRASADAGHIEPAGFASLDGGAAVQPSTDEPDSPA